MLEADAVRVELHEVAVAFGWDGMGMGLSDDDDDELMSARRTLGTRDEPYLILVMVYFR